MREGEGPNRSDDELPAGLRGVFEDLEQQAAGMHFAERDAQLLDRARGEYATVSFASRVHASVDHEVHLTLGSGQVVEGRLTQAGLDWCVVVPEVSGAVWVVRLAAVVAARGFSGRAVPEAARPITARLGFGSAVHRFAAESSVTRLHTAVGPGMQVRIIRIGADFFEAEPADTATGGRAFLIVPFAGVEAVSSG